MNITRLVDQAITMSLYLNSMIFIQGIMDANQSFFYTISFVVIAIIWFIWGYFSFSTPSVRDKSINTSVNLENISKFLYTKNFILHEKIGKFYVFKSRNIILPSPKVFVKNNGQDNLILIHATNIEWVKQGLEEMLTKK